MAVRHCLTNNKLNVSDKDGRMSNTALAGITNLKKLCNHPDLLWDKVCQKEPGFEMLKELYPPYHDARYENV